MVDVGHECRIYVLLPVAPYVPVLLFYHIIYEYREVPRRRFACLCKFPSVGSRGGGKRATTSRLDTCAVRVGVPVLFFRSTMERTYIMIKPDGVQRNLVGEIIARFEKKGYKLAALKVHTYLVPGTLQQQ